ncbi:hypothetical protein [Thermocoleostomius sinensis]|jgi:amino acid permease|uniref:Uncharacterized protein n=1 Tax=Thermocoleostomius sinensis A174 TaxID=2016057 RepID=A0A9E8ZEA7_9CYAN|nr:hypothetical protein [Thermocoleostomius sinensis]WAL61236.1 hypothetical protein OXH18_04340 [Thermocoleostomius sinensis A174]
MLGAWGMQTGLLLQIYGFNVLIVASILCLAFFSDRSTPKHHVISWLVVALASIFWFIALPLSFLEIMRKVWKQQRALSKRNPSRNLG